MKDEIEDDGATFPATHLPGVPERGVDIELDVVVERYEIRSLLGRGGMGRVYRAYDRSLDEDVALKMLRRDLVDTPGMLDRFRQEVRLARRVTSPYVVRTFDLGEHGDLHFLTMEYVEGRSLAQLLEHAPLALDEVLRIARGVAAGIAAAHAAGVLHRDLKPDNVLIAETGRIAVTDFGIARPADATIDDDERCAGTPAYMAPEQVTGEGVIGPHTDVYAFGAILFEMLTGRRAFPGSSTIEVATARVTQAPPDPRALRSTPDQLAELVLRCMARATARRFAEGAALVAALTEIELRGPAPTLPPPRPAVPTKSARMVALLPLRAPGELAELADGLAEEIVDALSMTRDVRVRPLASVRAATRALLGEDRDARAIGEVLGVDVVVDGSLRREPSKQGAGADAVVRITARVIGVADGFQLWAGRFETSSDGLLAVGDEIARAVARALAVDISITSASARDARATELYLEGKAKLRQHWREARLQPAIDDLEAARTIDPADPDVLAALAMGLARMSFQNHTASHARAVELAERAVAIAPAAGDAWLALGFARLYGGRPVEAGFAASRAVARSPGLAPAQALLGSLLLEAGSLDAALAHLEASHAIDPLTEAQWDLARAHAYAGDYARAAERIRRSPNAPYYSATQLARFRMWQGLTYDEEAPAIPHGLPPVLEGFSTAFLRIARTRQYDDTMRSIAHVEAPRLRCALAQMLAEAAMFANEPALALDLVGISVTSGLQDALWIRRCPLLLPIHGTPRFAELAGVVEERAATVLASIRVGQQDAALAPG